MSSIALVIMRLIRRLNVVDGELIFMLLMLDASWSCIVFYHYLACCGES